MAIAKEFKKVFQQLMHDSVAHIAVGGSDITIRIFDNATKYSLSTEVYFGGNFIPKSVRTSLEKKVSFSRDASVKTFLSVDEKNFRIYLNYLGKLERVTTDAFHLVLEEFSWVADEWRLFLDEHDKNDLVYVRVKP